MRIHPVLRFLGLAAAVAFAVAPLAAQDSPRVEIMTSVRHAVTPPLSSFVPFLHEKPNPPFRVFPLGRPVPPAAKGGKPGGGGGGGGRGWTDGDLVSPTTTTNGTQGSVFQGIADGCAPLGGCVPPDPNLSVGPSQIVQIVNVEFAVWDKPSTFGGAATQALAPAPIHTIFSSLGSADLCATTDGGDPIVLWDKFDKRWIISQLAYNSTLSDDHWCLAISTGTNPQDATDAAGSYSVYDFSFNSNFPDYPKLGIWLDSSGTYSGVYFSVNTFANGNSFVGAKACAFPLSDVSSPPSQITMVCTQQPSSVYNILPADTDGATSTGLNAIGGLYLQFLGSNGVGNTLDLYEFQPNFSAQTANFQLLRSIPVITYHEACGGSACVPQAGTHEKLDSLGDRLMYRLAYRNTTSVPDTLLVNQSVQVSSSNNQTGIRWYEIQNPENSNYSVIQGTYSPDTSLYRWMGSIASDAFGDIGLGYSVSNSSTPPSLAFTGRTPNDSQPVNGIEALEPETRIYTGVGSQSNVNRWGDYSSTSVDPSDDCTFWYTNEYLKTNGSYTNWGTVIASFRLSSSCK